MNSDNSKTSDPPRLLLDLSYEINLKRNDTYVALSKLSIYYTWKNIKKSYKNNEFKISAPKWNEEFELPDGPYSVSDIQDYFKYILKKHGEKTNNCSTECNGKLSQQLKSGLNSTINWNKYQSKTTTQNFPNPYLAYLTDQSFQGVNRLFVLAFNANENRIVHLSYYLPTEKVEDHNIMIDGKNFFDQTVKISIKTHGKIQKITTGQGDGYKTGCLLNYNYFNKHYQMTTIDLSKQEALDVDPKAIQ